MSSFDGFYVAYLTGSASQGFAMFVLKDGKIVGADASGAVYDGGYEESPCGVSVNLKVSIPPNIALIQGLTTGPEGDVSELQFPLPADFVTQPFLRVETKHGPVNAKLVKLRELE